MLSSLPFIITTTVVGEYQQETKEGVSNGKGKTVG
jgi:hypothetical protein